MSSGAASFFQENMHHIEKALYSIDESSMHDLIEDCEKVLSNGNKIIASGLGKNVPICDKFVGTMLSLGLPANFLHTNSAVHGDLGMVQEGDLVIVLTKSGSTIESVHLIDHLEKRDHVKVWLLTFSEESQLSDRVKNKIVIDLEHEGDMWNIVPNNSTTVNLIVLQTLAMELAKRLDLSLESDFKPNHPGGAIGAILEKA